jgi:hypothetical protein
LNWNIIENAPVVASAAATGVESSPVSYERPVVTSEADCAAYENYVGFEPVNYAEFCLDEIPPQPAVDARTPTEPSDTAYALDIGFVSDNFVSHKLNEFSVQTVHGLNTRPIFAMDFDATATTLYAIDNTSREFGTIDLADGSFDPIAIVSGIPPADNMSGLAIDPVTNEAYVSALGAEMTLYSFDLGSAVATFVGSDSTVPLLIDISISPSGEMYGHEINTDSIYKINRDDGSASLVGPTGYNANFAQGMDFDNEDGTLYAYLYLGGGANVYGIIDLFTGQLTPLDSSNPQGEFEGSVQNTSVCTAGDVPWAAVQPTSGTTGPGGSSPVDVVFDATGYSPGTYTGTICIQSNDLDDPLVTVPLTMTVSNYEFYFPVITNDLVTSR